MTTLVLGFRPMVAASLASALSSGGIGCGSEFSASPESDAAGGDGGTDTGNGTAGTAGTDPCAECTGATPACEPVSGTCVGCLASDDCSDTTRPLCDTEAKECVACLASEDCTDPTASRCEAGACVACQSNDDCGHIEGQGVCDAGTCVECTGTDYTACGSDNGTPLVCDSTTRTCTTNQERAAGLCQPCVSDAHCALGQLCVLQTFGDPAEDVGYFCFWKQGDTENGAPADCFATGRPYVRIVEDATSIDGEVAAVCGLAVSTCPARNDFRAKDCAPDETPDDTLCGFDGPNDARCVQIESEPGTYRCTMRCLSSDDCLEGSSCNTGASQPYCQL